jgi:hypothetical protein
MATNWCSLVYIMEVWCMIDFLGNEYDLCSIDDWLLVIYTGTANWVMMTNKNMLYSMEQVCRFIHRIYEDECTGVSRDNCVGILVIVMVLVHLCYRCYYIFCGCTNGEVRDSKFCWYLSNSDHLSSSMLWMVLLLLWL